MVVGGAPALVSQLVGHSNAVNKVILVPNDTALISVSDDRFVKHNEILFSVHFLY